jgi:hypothetical protein
LADADRWEVAMTEATRWKMVAIGVGVCAIGVGLWGFCLGTWYGRGAPAAAGPAEVSFPAAAAAAPKLTEYVTPPRMKIPAAFPQTVSFRIGETQFLDGDKIRITEADGISDKMAVGNAYQIKGVYTLASHDWATLGVYVTSDAKEHDPVDDHQSITITKGSGAFTLVLPLYCRGWPHVSFYSSSGGGFGGAYFGSGEYLH